MSTWPNLDYSDLLARARFYVNEATANFFTADEFKKWFSIASRIVNQYTLSNRKILDAVTVKDVRTVDTNVYKVLYVEYVPATGRPTMLGKIDPLKTGHYPIDGTYPQWWFELGDQIGIEPIPDAAYALRLYVCDIPKLIILDEDSFTSGWTGNNWTYGASAIHTGTSSDSLIYGTSLAADANHTVIFTLSNMGTSSSVTPRIGTSFGVPVTTPGVHMQNITSPSTSPSLAFVGVGSCTLDDVIISQEADFSATTDQTEIMPMFQHLMILYAAGRALQKDQRPVPANLLLQIILNESDYLRQNYVDIIPNGRDDLNYK